jgi:thiol-disulfide isomerase/thioredoxin
LNASNIFEDLMRSSIAFCLSLFIQFGCNAQNPAASVNQSGKAQPAKTSFDGASPASLPTEAKQPGTTEAVTVEIKDLEGIQELIASKRGKVVVMDCWSTWCDPCVKEFPGLVKLHQKYGPDRIVCISLSFDYEGGKNDTPEEHKEPVLEFLRSQGATFDNVIASVPPDELYKPLGFKTAAVPAIFVYDRDGNVATQFESAEAKYSEVEKLVAELLQQTPDEKP